MQKRRSRVVNKCTAIQYIISELLLSKNSSCKRWKLDAGLKRMGLSYGARMSPFSVLKLGGYANVTRTNISVNMDGYKPFYRLKALSELLGPAKMAAKGV